MSWLRRLYLPVVIGAFAALIWGSRDTLKDLLSNVEPRWLLAALAASFITLVPQADFWNAALKGLGESSSFSQVFIATCRALLTRYIPGGVWFAAGRGALLQRHGIGVAALAATGTVELAMSAAVALSLGTALMGSSKILPTWTAWIGPVLLTGLFIAIPWINKALAWIARRRNASLPRELTSRLTSRLLVANIVYWLTISTVFWLYLKGFGLASDPIGTRGAFMAAWGIGFLSPFAPQGLGVFEVILSKLLGGDLTEMISVIAGFRALLLVRDLFVWASAESLHRLRR